MSPSRKRYHISRRETREIIRGLISAEPGLREVIPEGMEKRSLMAVEYGERGGVGRVLFHEGRPILVQLPDGEVVPFLGTLRDPSVGLPSVIVDEGAVRFLANGADVMGPGIVGVEGDPREGGLVVVRDERYLAPVCVGRTLRPARELRKRGKSVKNLHHVGDGAYRTVREELGGPNGGYQF